MALRSRFVLLLLGIALVLGSCRTTPPPDPQPLAAPSGVTLTAVADGVLVSWRFDGSSIQGLGFEVERAVAGGSFGALASASGGARTYLDSSAALGVQYDFRLRATANAMVSPFSATASFVADVVDVGDDAAAFVGIEATKTGLLVPGAALHSTGTVSVSVSDAPSEPVERQQIGPAVRVWLAKADLDLTAATSLYLAVPPTVSRASMPEGTVGAVVRVATRSGAVVEFPAVYSWNVRPIRVDMWWLQDIEANEGLPDLIEIEVVPVFTPLPPVDASGVTTAGGARGPAITHLVGLHRLDGSATFTSMDGACLDDRNRVSDYASARTAFGAISTSASASEAAWTDDVDRLPLVLVHGWQAVSHAHFDLKGDDAALAAALCGWRAFINSFQANEALSSRFTLYTYGYDSVNSRVARNAQAFRDRLHLAFGDTPVFAIGHSMGGLLVHNAIELGANVAQLYSLGTPYRGSAATECIDASGGVCTLVESVFEVDPTLERVLERTVLRDQTHSLRFPGTMDLAFEESFVTHWLCEYSVDTWVREQFCEHGANLANPYLQALNVGGPSRPLNYTAFAGNIIGPDGRLDHSFGRYGAAAEGAVQMFRQLDRYGDYIVSVGSAVFADLTAEQDFSFADLARLQDHSSLGTAMLAPCHDHGRLTKETHELRRAPQDTSCNAAPTYPAGEQTVFGWIASDLMRRAPGSPRPGEGLVTASVLDAVTAAPLTSVMIGVCPASGGCYSVGGGHGSDGRYSFSLPADAGYAISFSRIGYLEATYANVTVAAGETTFLQQLLLIDEAYDVPAGASGRITDALTGAGVGGAALSLRVGFGTTSGPVVASTMTDGTGAFAFSNLAAGYYALEITRSGYVSAVFSITVVGGQANANQNSSISPELTTSEVRVVLTWGATPSDLDSHLTGPSVEGGRFHVYYGNRTYVFSGRTYAQLDRDVVTSYGPETITVHEQVPGVYRYSVHDYSNRSLSYSTALGNSGAQVRVYRGSTLVREFNVPASNGTLWTVFELDGAILTPVNAMSYEASPINVQGLGVVTDGELLQILPLK
jgi:pimeloyl-ACP methyl ester carboxylesterase